MILPINIEDNQKTTLSSNSGKLNLQDEPVFFKGKAKKLTKALKKVPNGDYWLSILNIEETQELLIVINITNKKTNLLWPKKEQI